VTRHDNILVVFAFVSMPTSLPESFKSIHMCKAVVINKSLRNELDM
jgi:hypothetical protein